jgi:phage terminase small subunit
MSKDKPTPKLTPKQTLFVKYYLESLNASAAAKAAGYSERTAHASGRENLHKPAVAAAIQKEMDKRAQRLEITADYVLKGIKATIEGATRETDKLKGYELLGKHLKLFSDRLEHSGPDGQPIQTQLSVDINVIGTGTED